MTTTLLIKKIKVLFFLTGLLLILQTASAQKRKANHTPLMGIEHKRGTHKRWAIIKMPLHKHDFTMFSGMGVIFNSSTSIFFLSGEYSISENIGIKGTFETNNISFKRKGFNYHTYYLDGAYHFIQTRRFDMHAFLGLGLFSHRYIFHRSVRGPQHTFDMLANAGLGLRIKIAPDFGVQFEIGTRSNLGVYKTFTRKK